MNSGNGAGGKNLAGRKVGGMLLAALVGSAGVGVGLHTWQSGQAHKGRVYTAEGMGGWVMPDKDKPTIAEGANDPLSGLRADYRAGKWTDVDSKAADLMARGQFSSSAGERRQAGQAELLAAYACAWRKDYAGAGRKFLAVQRLAGELPDHGAVQAKLGDTPQPTLEEEAGFQHAVCLSAEGDTAGAEAEYDDFMRQYPQSILIHAAIKRVTRLHKGDIPHDAEALWTAAMKVQKAKQEQEQREGALCGPECLAELLRRQGKKADVHALANEMKTDANGTSLQQVASVAQTHGLAGTGLELTQSGLARQKLPLIALLRPGHYVIVDKVMPAAVTVWNPDLNGVGKEGTKIYPLVEWQEAWSGVGLCLNHD